MEIIIWFLSTVMMNTKSLYQNNVTKIALQRENHTNINGIKNKKGMTSK